MKIPSTTTLLPVAAVAELADVSRQTLYNWVSSGVVVPRFDVQGKGPLFTTEEAREIRRMAEKRRAARTVLGMP